MRSLALSGGGAQGLYTAHILSRFEEPFIENFDVVAGTSIGAALACGLVWGWTADELVELFEKNVAEIFPQSYVPHPDVGRFWKASKGVNKPRYRVEPWKDLLEEMLGDARFGEAARKVVIPAIRLEDANLVRFCSWKPQHQDIKVVDLVLASSAAPTYFPIHKFPDGVSYVDGGMSSNAPDMLALTEMVCDLKVLVQDIEMLSIGTGSSNPYIPSDDFVGWGLRHWVTDEKISDLSMAITQNTPLSLITDWLGERHVRVDTCPSIIERKHLGLDGACDKAKSTLKRLAMETDISHVPSFFAAQKPVIL